MIFNFSGAFWGNLRNFRNSQAFDELLSKPDVTLEQVMDDEDVVQEMKNQNPKLLALYFSLSFTPARLHELLSLTVTEPPEDADHRRGHKHPFLAAELMGCEAPQLLQSIFEDPDLLALLFSLLSSPSLNLTLAGYFSKLFHSLASRNLPHLLALLCAQDHAYLEKLVHQVKARSVADCVLRVLLFDDAEEYVLERQGVVERLVGMVCEGGDQAVSAVSILGECLQKNTEMKNWKAVFSVLFSPVTLMRLIECFSSASASALCLFTLLLSHPLFLELVGEGLLQLEEMLEGSIHLLESLLEKEEFALGVGEARLKCVEMLIPVYKADLQALEGVVGRSRLPDLCTQLFFHYSQNSFLHQSYLQLLQSVLNCSDISQKRLFLQNSGLISRLLEWKTEEKLESGKVIRAGYVGHAIRLAQMVNKALEACAELQTSVESLSEWTSFVANTLNPILELESRPYGGSKPTDTLEDDSDEPNDIKEEVSPTQKFSSFLASIDKKEPEEQLE